jgi:hypothetical protein
MIFIKRALKDDRVIKAAIGLSASEFNQLVQSHFRKLKDSTKPKLAVLTRRGHITFNLKQSHFYTFFHIQWMRNEYPHFDRP